MERGPLKPWSHYAQNGKGTSLASFGGSRESEVKKGRPDLALVGEWHHGLHQGAEESIDMDVNSVCLKAAMFHRGTMTS